MDQSQPSDVTAQVAQLIAKFGPGILRLLGRGTAGAGIDTMGGMIQHGMQNPQLLAAAQNAVHPNGLTPTQRVGQGFDQFGPQGAPPAPMLPTPPTPGPVDMGAPPPSPPQGGLPPQAPAPALSAQAPPAPQAPPPPAAPPVPMPQARPPQAPAAPADLSFWSRNSAMMRDPMTGQFIDPAGATQAQSQQASGPDVINKLLEMFHNKDNPNT